MPKNLHNPKTIRNFALSKTEPTAMTKWRGGWVAETTGLLNRRREQSCPRVRISSSPPYDKSRVSTLDFYFFNWKNFIPHTQLFYYAPVLEERDNGVAGYDSGQLRPNGFYGA